MLSDLDSPGSQRILAAAHALGTIHTAAKSMTVAPRRERIRLRDGCTSAFETLRRLACSHFTDRPAIPPAINELEKALSELADLSGLPDDGPLAQFECPACGNALQRRGLYGKPAPIEPTDIYCSQCLDRVWPSMLILSSIGKGFGIDAI